MNAPVLGPVKIKKVLKPKKKLSSRQKKIRIIGWGIFVGLFTAFMIWGFMGAKYGDMRYAVCKVFVQRYLHFPNTMRVRDYLYYGDLIRIWITYIDSAGQYNYDSFECQFKPKKFELQNVTKERRQIDPETIKGFNYGIDAILQNPPDLKLPRRPRDTPLRELWHGEY